MIGRLAFAGLATTATATAAAATTAAIGVGEFAVRAGLGAFALDAFTFGLVVRHKGAFALARLIASSLVMMTFGCIALGAILCGDVGAIACFAIFATAAPTATATATAATAVGAFLAAFATFTAGTRGVGFDVARLVGIDPADVRCDLPVRLAPRRVDDELVLPLFEPAEA